MIHVCHLVNSLSIGGAEQTVLNLVQADEDTQFTVCSLESEGDLAPRLRQAGADVYTCAERFRFDPFATAKLQRYLSDRDVDILHTHLPYAQVIGRVVAETAGIDTVVSTQHTMQSQYHPVTGWLERVTARYDTATVAVSEGVKSSFIKEEGDRSARNWRIIHNGIDVTGFNNEVSASEMITDPGQGPLFLSVGRCVPIKAQSTLVAAMPQVIASLDDAHLLVAGDGPLLVDLREHAADLGISDHITFAGSVSPIEPYYAAADVFVLPSRGEGLPITVLEAMAAELPVVASDIPGIAEVVQDGTTGLLVPPDEPNKLATAMIKAVNNDPKTAGQTGYKRVAENFDIDEMIAAYNELYKMCIVR